MRPILIAPPRSKTELQIYLQWLETYGFSGKVLKEGDLIDSPLLLCGGSDIGVNEKRDILEFEWIRAAIANKQPIIGICRGMQVLNYFFGGKIDSLDEFLTEDHRCDDFNDDENHHERLSHFHWVVDKSGEASFVNSRHHQFCRKIADNFETTHFSVGGGNISEAIKDPYRNIWAVQWHPERMESTDNQYPLNMI